MNQENLHTEEQELSKEAPLLFSHRPAIDKAPEGYFDHLAEQVLKKASTETPLLELKPQSNSIKLLKIMGIAAAIALGLFLLKPTTIEPLDDTRATAELHEEDIDYLMEIDSEVIIDFYAETLEAQSETSIDYLMEEMELEEIILNLDI